MIRRVILLSFVAILFIVYAIWQIAFYGIHPKLIFSPPPAEPVPPAALDEIVSIDVEGELLTKVLDDVGRRYGVLIDFGELTTNGIIKGNEVVTRRIDGVTLQSAIQWIFCKCVDRELVIEGRGTTVVVDTQTNWQSKLTNYSTRVYPLTALLANAVCPSEQELADTIRSLLDEYNWEENGGIGVIETVPGALIVLQTPDIHRQIKALIDGLAALDERPDPTAPVIIDERSMENRDKILAALDESTNIVFAGKSLDLVCRELSRKHGIPIQSNNNPYDERHPFFYVRDANDPALVTSRFRDISLQSALNLLDNRLSFDIRDGALFVSNNEWIQERTTLRIYPTADLLDQRYFASSDELMDEITRNVSPEDWIEGGGIGDLKVCASALFVSAPGPVHEELERYLAQLRGELMPWIARSTKKKQSAASRRIEKVLNTNVSMHFDNVHVTDVARHIAKTHKVNVWLDGGVLHRISPPIWPEPPVDDNPFGGVSDPFGGDDDEVDDPFRGPNTTPATESDKEEQPDESWNVTFHADDIRLEIALQWLLEQLELEFAQFEMGFEVRNESIVIVTGDDLASWLTTKRYSIAPFGRADPSSAIGDRLREATTDVVDAGNWADVGGSGEIDVHRRSLVVSQTRKNHAAVRRLLDQLVQQLSRPERTDPICVESFPGQRNAEIERILNQTCEIEIKGQTLGKFAAMIEKIYSIPVVLDRDSLNTNGVNADYALVAPIGAKLSVRNTIDIILSQAEATFVIHDGRIRIIADSSYDEFPTVKIYGVADIIEQTPGSDEFQLARLLEGHLNQLFAEHSRQYYTYEPIHPLPGMMLVAKPYREHAALESVLAMLRRITDGERKVDAISIVDVHEDRFERIVTALRSETEITFESMPIRTAVEKICSHFDIPFVLQLAPMDGEQPRISFSDETKNEPLYDVLSEAFYEVDLEISIVEATLVIAPRQISSPIDDLRIFDVTDLIRLGNQATADPLVTQILDHPFSHFRNPYAGFYDRPEMDLPSTASSLERVLVKCLFSNARPNTNHWPIGLYGDFTIFGNSLCLAGDESAVEGVEWVLHELRDKAGKSPTSHFESTLQRFTIRTGLLDENAVVVQFYDVRPLLKKDKALTPAKIADLIQSVVGPELWRQPVESLRPQGIGNGGRFGGGFGGGFMSVGDTLQFGGFQGKGTRGGGIGATTGDDIVLGNIEPIDGFLVVRHTDELQSQVEKLLAFIDQLDHQWPKLHDMVGDESRSAIERVLNSLRKTDHDLTRRYAIWLLSLAKSPTPELVNELVDRFAVADLDSDPGLVRLLLKSIGRFGPAAAIALPLIEADLEIHDLKSHRSAYLQAMALLGSNGADALCRLLFVANRDEEKKISLAIVNLGLAATPLTPSLLKLDAERSLTWFHSIFRAIDPAGEALDANLKKLNMYDPNYYTYLNRANTFKYMTTTSHRLKWYKRPRPIPMIPGGVLP